MKHYLSSLILVIVSAIAIVGCGKETFVEKTVKSIVPEYDLKDFPEYKSFLESEVELCGKGVIDPEKKERNICAYHIEVTKDAMTGFKTGLKPTPKYTGEGIQWVKPTAADIAAVPESWDLRDVYPETKNVAINRQVCGDCWSQSTTKLLELMIAAYDKKIVPLSVQTQISTCRPDYGDCGGGYMTAADFITKIGNPLESMDPYKGQNSSCKFSSDELAKGFEYKLKSAPWVGSSLMYSKGNKTRAVNSAEEIKAMMYKYKSGALVTVYAYDISGNGIYSSCSAINAGGNHMVDIVGFEKVDGKDIAHVWNSWGKGHGLNGVSRIQWECGQGKLNRGLGLEARVYEYQAQCANQPEAITGPDQTIIKLSPGVGTLIGKKAKAGQTCTWLPKEGLSDPESCNPFASPDVSTEYHVTAKTECGEATSMVMVNVIGPKLQKSPKVLTPYGTITE